MVAFDGENNAEQVRAKEDCLSKEKGEVPHPRLLPKATSENSDCSDNHQNASLSKTQELLLKLAKLTMKQDDQGQHLNLPASGCETYIGMPDRDSAVSSIRVMQRFYSFGADTFASAVEYMDRFLSKVKVKRRYLSCISAACFYLSAKMNEETENLPGASELSSIHREVWKPSDLKRMEKLVLDKLGWKLYPSSSCLSFVEIMLNILQQIDIGIDEKFCSEVVDRLELFLNYSNCCIYKSSTLALATLHQCLKVFNISTVVSRFMMLQFQAACQISDSELFDCQCAISQQYDLYKIHSTTHPPCLPLPKILPRPNLVIRPSWYGNTDLPTIEEVPWSDELRKMGQVGHGISTAQVFLEFFRSASEEDEEVTDEMKSFTCVTNKSELVDGHLKETTFSLPKQQNFVGKIGVLYENYKCNITQA